ncbi:[NiFe] hydrogenase metallocenter assembly protein HypE [Klebsiella pneumoniae]|uniref:[NiFe] hydrogenase metallocenter assembly protein HypE n=1 Tax=Klebsiella pneumoniae TaxID=573 RepID=A0A378FM81_KLEPN|nr:[NiFe] hydrogenase metallocenter assembly protein HypE [Klebsiella pneumoniae]
MQQLIGDLFMRAFANPWLAEQEDQARLDLAALAAQGTVSPSPPTAT